jgi:hypothetical protein
VKWFLNIKDLYLQASGKPFIKNRKKELEMLIAYYWLSRMMGTDEDLKKYISIYVTI